MSTYVNIPHGTYFSYIFRKLGISTLRDTLISSNQLISYEALHHPGYHYDANSDKWIKSGHPTTNEDDDVKSAFEDILITEHATQPSFDISVLIVDALHFLSNDVWGLRDKFRSHINYVCSQLWTLEMQNASLLAHHPSTPLFSPSDED
ncbi:hypothetical protein PVK06_034932 [Gossypium arboreum]|uniref:Uncharacterized protein n=1 Tax=Gossypium arboreum TaxID=29729 RepID=A0ABR0NHN5_GOSAR|nr:hypothetical protein PVK06_034932 [Gossypium arboreum]